MDKNIRYKMTFVFAVIIIGFALVIFRLGYINMVHGDALRQFVEDDMKFTKVLPSSRGKIMDRNGNELAFSIVEYKVAILHPDLIDYEDYEALADELSRALNIDKEIIMAKYGSDKQFIITKEASVAERDAIDISFYQYLSLDPIRTRYYPNVGLASDIIGRTRIGDDDIAYGIYGMEALFDQKLTGTDGKKETQVDKRRRELVHSDPVITPKYDGKNIVLTIDSVIQHYVEQALEAGFKIHDPLKAHAMVMNVNNGEILAMASYPSFDPSTMDLIGMPQERMEALTDEERVQEIISTWTNDFVGSAYELGSPLKLVTAAIALEESVITPDTVMDTGNKIEVADRTIKAWYYPRDRGPENLAKAVSNSSNPFFVTLGQMIGKDTYYDYYEAFGLRERTDVDLYNEVLGSTFDRDKVGPTELATLTFGHGASNTPIQVATALAAVVNGGYLLEPHAVKRITDSDGMIEYEALRRVKRQVISEITSVQMRKIMEEVVTSGSASAVDLPGYRIGAKTGTAEKVIDGEYSKDQAIASFVAVAPINDPEILVYVIVDEPKADIYGSLVAGPIARDILIDTLDYLGVEKAYDADKEYLDIPLLVGLTIKEANELLEEIGMTSNVVTKGNYTEETLVTNQYPIAGSKRERGSVILIEIDN